MPTVPFQSYLRLTHTGQNTTFILISDMDTGYENQNRKSPVYVPVGGFIDIPLTSRALYSAMQGSIAGFAWTSSELPKRGLNLNPPCVVRTSLGCGQVVPSLLWLVAQLEERRRDMAKVAGSIPAEPTKGGRMRSWTSPFATAPDLKQQPSG